MRVLYVGAKYDYGKPEQGYSFEHCNLFDPLRRAADEVVYFDYVTLARQLGQSGMNRRLAEVVASDKPDLMFSVLFQDWLNFETIQSISEGGIARTVNWFTDDHWQFETRSSLWAPAFNWVVTTAQNAVPKYEQIGYFNAIKSQWACNHFLYRKFDLPLKYDVTFVGQPYGIRPLVVEALRASGIRVQCWGTGWPEGRLTPEQMIEVFNQSRVNLNFANASTSGSVTQSAARAITRTIRHGVSHLPGAKWMYRGVRDALRRRRSRHMPPSTVLVQNGDQIKGRIFEVLGCGGLLMTGPADNLDDYYKRGEELITYETLGDLVRAIRNILDHEDERAAIAERGYQRTLAEHTYLHRYRHIFQTMGFDVTLPLDNDKPAAVIEITA